jgi:uncharacterized RDD family membrane protein YckC
LSAEPVAAGVLRRLAAATYDGLLLLAVLMTVTALVQLRTHGAAITPASAGWVAYLFRVLLAFVVYVYFASAWTRRGQTLGMKAWRIRLETLAGAAPGWGRVALRLAVAAPLYLLALAGVLLFMTRARSVALCVALAVPLVANCLWHAVRGTGTLQDRLSGTRVVAEP